MQFTIRRGAADNTLTITDNGEVHRFDLTEIKWCKGMPHSKPILDATGEPTGEYTKIPMGRSYRPILPTGLREMVVSAWAEAHGFPPIDWDEFREAA